MKAKKANQATRIHALGRGFGGQVGMASEKPVTVEKIVSTAERSAWLHNQRIVCPCGASQIITFDVGSTHCKGCGKLLEVNVN